MEILGANIRTVISDFFSGIENRLSLAHTAYTANGTYIPGRGVGGYPVKVLSNTVVNHVSKHYVRLLSVLL